MDALPSGMNRLDLNTGRFYTCCIVTGRLAPGAGKIARSIKSARTMRDRLDREYGASVHTYKIMWVD